MEKIRAVNLGGWLVLEKWMKPSLFSGLDAKDESNFVLNSPKKDELLEEHRDTWITKKDFAYLRASGINVVRLPVPWWLFSRPHEYPFPYNSPLKYIDRAFKYAEEAGLKIMLDLHTAPGCQNGFDNGGILGVIEWDKDPKNIDMTLEVLETLAGRYKNRPGLHSIEVLNEPRASIDLNLIKDFYIRAYRSLREILKEEVYIVFHDAFRFDEWFSFFSKNNFTNVILDTHHYQCFLDKFNDMTEEEFLEVPYQAVKHYKEMEKHVPVFIGEWSLGNNRNIPYTKRTEFLEKFARSQLEAFSEVSGWAFWSYRVEDADSPWHFKNLNLKGIIKDKLIKL